jgi:excisionase family DNA binding protein
MDKREISVAEYLQRIDERQQSIENLMLSQKNVLTFDEGATYMGVSKSHLYKLTMAGSIAFYKPRGKMIYFDRAELEKWLLQNRITPADELEAKASTYVALNNRKGVKHV